MIKNVPPKYSQRKLLRELLSAGFQGKIDFIYLPLDPRTRSILAPLRKGLSTEVLEALLSATLALPKLRSTSIAPSMNVIM